MENGLISPNWTSTASLATRFSMDHDNAEQETGILNLHDDLLHFILSGLDDPKDLAAVSFQCRRLRHLASASPVWERQCRHRWSDYGIPLTLLDEYGWPAIYGQLAALPDLAAKLMGMACKTKRNREEPISYPQVIVEDAEGFNLALVALFQVGVAATRGPGMLEGYAIAVLRRDLGAWLSTAPHVPLEIMRRLQAMLPYGPQCDGQECRFGVLDLVLRRSAIQFLLEVMAPRGTDPSEHAAVLGDLAREAATFDAKWREDFESAPMPRAPPGPLPLSHWWWRLEAEVPVE